ncbi:MAG: pyridoxal phosphate-dependent aminotransferase [Halobacteria archaeon]
MRRLSRRFDEIGESATLRASDRAARLRKEGRRVFAFTLGEPDFPTPAPIRQAAARAAARGETHYTPSAGIPELREAVARKLRRENRVPAEAGNVVVTSGAKQAIYEACQALIEPGDEVLLIDPAWVTLAACVKMAGGRVVWCRDLGEAAARAGPGTKLLILNSPNNPSGAVLSRKEIGEAADLARDRDLWVLSDEIYEKIVYGKPHVSIASLPGMAERTVVVNGFSKSYAMTGWRIGWAVAPPEVANVMLKVQQHTVTCAPSIAQHGALAALKMPASAVAKMVREFRARRDILVEGLRDLGFAVEPPAGTFYLWLGVASRGGGAAFAEKILEEAGVAVTPGDDFGPSGKDYVRFSYACGRETIREALERLGQVQDV